MCKLAKVTKKDVIYDLGSGDGTALMVAATEYGATGVGIEIDPFRVFVSRIVISLKHLQQSIEIRKLNFFQSRYLRGYSYFCLPCTENIKTFAGEIRI